MVQSVTGKGRIKTITFQATSETEADIPPVWYSIFDDDSWTGIAGDTGQSAAVWGGSSWTIYFQNTKSVAYLTEANDSMDAGIYKSVKMTFTGDTSDYLTIRILADDTNPVIERQIESGEAYELDFSSVTGDINKIEFSGNYASFGEQTWEITNIEFLENS